MTAVEKHVCYAATVTTVADAWRLVMSHVDEFTEPRIEIRPRRSKADTEEETTVEFEVTIGGLVTP